MNFLPLPAEKKYMLRLFAVSCSQRLLVKAMFANPCENGTL